MTLQPADDSLDFEANLASWMKITTVDALREYQRGGPVAKYCVIYVRQSKSRDKSESIESQTEICKELARREGLIVIAVYEDRNRSGKDFGRRKVSQCIEHIRRGEAQVVIMWKWSRFGRNLFQSLANLAVLDEAGGLARAATEDVNARTAMGKFSRNTMLSLAEFELDRYSEGWKEVQNRREQTKGVPMHGTPRFGYQRTTIVVGREVVEKYVPDPATGPVLVEAYDRYLAGEALLAIARDFNSRGIRSVRGSTLNNKTLQQILDSGFATGYMRRRENPRNKDNEKPGKDFAFIKGTHEPLITMDTWRAYLMARKANTEKRERHSTAGKYALSGRIYCECGWAMAAGTQGKKGTARYQRTFRCTRYLKAGSFTGCAGVSITQETANKALRDWLMEKAETAPEEQMLESARIEARARQKAESMTDVQALLDELNRKRKRIGKAYVAGVYTDEERDEELLPVLAEIEQLEGLLVESQRDVRQLRRLPDRSVLVEFAAMWDEARENERRELLATIGLTAHVKRGRWVEDKITFTTLWDRPQEEDAA